MPVEATLARLFSFHFALLGKVEVKVVLIQLALQTRTKPVDGECLAMLELVKDVLDAFHPVLFITQGEVGGVEGLEEGIVVGVDEGQGFGTEEDVQDVL